MKLQSSYYLNQNVLFLAKDLLEKVLFTQKEGQTTTGVIVETEAYFGEIDKASPAYGGRHKNRTKIMYSEGGVSYVYLCYGIHHLFNVVSSVKGEPYAVLIRAIEPMIGTEIIELRRKMSISKSAIYSAPRSAATALGIYNTFNEKDLGGEEIWLEDYGIRYAKHDVVTLPRVWCSIRSGRCFFTVEILC